MSMEIKELIIYIILLAIAVVFSFLEQTIKQSKNAEKAKTVIDVINMLAPDAVVAVEKLGLTKQLSGNEKLAQAVNYVQNGLAKLGFTAQDVETIKNAVEKHWADLSANGTLDAYDKKPVDKPTSDTSAKTVAETVQDALVKAINDSADKYKATAVDVPDKPVEVKPSQPDKGADNEKATQETH